jgi:hypothetical protein
MVVTAQYKASRYCVSKGAFITLTSPAVLE